MVLLSEDARRQLVQGGDRGALERELSQQLDTLNGTAEPHEKLAFLVVVKDPWTMENGMLTPTMKIRRNVIERAYQERMAEWAAVGRKVVWET